MKTLGLQAGHHLQLLCGAQALFDALVQALEAARTQVFIETYIADAHGATERVAAALVRAAQRGVAVHLLADGAGTPQLPADWAARFDAAGVRWLIVRPVRHWRWLQPRNWRRLHRKLALVDGQTLFCGGINLIDDHWDLRLGALPQPRLDFALRVQGPLVAQAQRTLAADWARVALRQAAQQGDWPAMKAAWALAEASWPNQAKTQAGRAQDAPESGAIKGLPQAQTQAGGARARLVWRDNLRHRRDIERAYLAAIAGARHEVVLAHAYFVPGRRLVAALLAARARGLRVAVLLQGQVEYRLATHAQAALLGCLLAAGVEVWRYAHGLLHAKVGVIDGHWVTVGSSNLDPISLLLAKEANVVCDDTALAGQLRATLQSACERGAQRLHAEQLAQRSLGQRALDALALGLLRLAVVVVGKRY